MKLSELFKYYICDPLNKCEKQNTCPNSMIILDAMDECKQNKDLSNVIVNNLQYLPNQIKIFVSTRPGLFDNDRIKLTNANTSDGKSNIIKLYKLDVNDERNKKDLIDVLDNCLINKYPTLSKDNKDKIMKILEMKSEGRFLWISYVVGILERISNSANKDMITPEWIDKNIPNGLDEMYEYLLKPLKEYLDDDKFNKAFSTIIASRVLLNIDIWKQILGYSDNIGNNSNDNKGEIEFMKLKNEFNHLLLFSDDVIRVIHKLQTEYIEESENGLKNGLRINRLNGHKYLGLLCDDICNKTFSYFAGMVFDEE